MFHTSALKDRTFAITEEMLVGVGGAILRLRGPLATAGNLSCHSQGWKRWAATAMPRAEVKARC